MISPLFAVLVLLAVPHGAFALPEFGALGTQTPSARITLYAYCDGDPVNRHDPSGLKWLLYRTDDGYMPFWQPDPGDLDPTDSGKARAFTATDLFTAVQRLNENPSLGVVEMGSQDIRHAQPAYNLSDGVLSPLITAGNPQLDPIRGFLYRDGIGTPKITHADLETIAGQYVELESAKRSSQYKWGTAAVTAPATLALTVLAAPEALAIAAFIRASPLLATRYYASKAALTVTATSPVIVNAVSDPLRAAPANFLRQELAHGTPLVPVVTGRVSTGTRMPLTNQDLLTLHRYQSPVYVVPPGGVAVPAEMAQIQTYAAGSNQAVMAGALSPTGRVSTSGALEAMIARARQQERARAARAGVPYGSQVAGHVPDSTWTGGPVPFLWMPLDRRVNSSLGAQTQNYPVGYVPTWFEVLNFDPW